MKSSRRTFVKSGLTLAAGTSLIGRSAESKGTPGGEKGVLHEGYAIEPRPSVQEATLAKLKDGRYWLLFGEGSKGAASHYKDPGFLKGRFSDDRGRSWQETMQLQTKDGSPIATARVTPHHSLFRLPSGALGLIHGGPYARSGRDGTVLFRKSTDEGQSWSAPVTVDPYFSLSRTGSVRVLSNGRILTPVVSWISPDAGPTSESVGRTLFFTLVFYSDNEGESWNRALSELFIPWDKMNLGAQSFDEPVVEELKDGRVLMYARTQMGRLYQSVSEDRGITWSVPSPLPHATSDAPCTLIRIPATSDLLLVWNQVSEEEIKAGLNRHRLSCAVSQDEGKTWKHHRNLESLDDTTHVPPPEGPLRVIKSGSYTQPTDRERYHRAPGPLRVSYCTVAFTGDEVTFAYDYGYGVGELLDAQATKIKIVSLDWLYGRV